MFSMIEPRRNIQDVMTMDNCFIRLITVEVPTNRITGAFYTHSELGRLNNTCTDFSLLSNCMGNLQDELFSLLYKNHFYSTLSMSKRYAFYMMNPYTKLKYSAWWKEKSPRKFFYGKLSLLEKIKQLLAMQMEILTDERKLDWYWELVYKVAVGRGVY